MSAELPISAETAEWLKQALADTFNDDFMGAYQRDQVGPVPADLCEWAGIDSELFARTARACDLCGGVSDSGQQCGESFVCDDCYVETWA